MEAIRNSKNILANKPNSCKIQNGCPKDVLSIVIFIIKSLNLTMEISMIWRKYSGNGLGITCKETFGTFENYKRDFGTVYPSFKVRLSTLKKVVFICFSESPLKMMKDTF